MKLIKLSVYVLFFLLISCTSPKETYLSEFGDFINKVELESSNYSDEDWKYIDVEYNDFAEIQFMEIENELTEIEKKQVDSYKKRYTKLTVKYDPTGKILEILGIE